MLRELQFISAPPALLPIYDVSSASPPVLVHATADTMDIKIKKVCNFNLNQDLTQVKKQICQTLFIAEGKYL